MPAHPVHNDRPFHRSFLDVEVNRTTLWVGSARVDNVTASRSWRITAHEPRLLPNAGRPDFEPQAPAAAGAPGRRVNIDAGLLMRVRWAHQQVNFEAIVDYVFGRSFSVQGEDCSVAILGRLVQTRPGAVLVGATIEPADQGAMSAWVPSRSKDTGTIAHVAGGVTDSVKIDIPPHAVAFRWHQYLGPANGAASAITFVQFDGFTGTAARASYRTASTPASWPTATGALPIVGTTTSLTVQNNDAVNDIAMWIEFLLDLGG